MPLRDGWLSLIILLPSLPMHFMHLLASPPGVHGDAARLGPYALDFLKRCLWPFYIHHQFAPHPLITYLQAPLFAAFGFGLALLRGATALAAALAAPAGYLTWREIVVEGGFDLLLVPERPPVVSSGWRLEDDQLLLDTIPWPR